MKNKIKRNRKFQGMFIGSGILILGVILFLGVRALVDGIHVYSVKAADYTQYPAKMVYVEKINVKRRQEPELKEFDYNSQVPEPIILEELYKLADRFNLNGENWEKLVRCEATCTKQASKDHGCVPGELDNLAQNSGSTAVGIGQYLIRTWYVTESWKQYKRARTDYKASLFEQALDLSYGQQDKWQECLDITGIYEFVK